MKKSELKNALVELNLLQIISTEEMINMNIKLEAHFENFNEPNEFRAIGNNENTQEYCECAKPNLTRMPDGRFHCINCWYPYNK